MILLDPHLSTFQIVSDMGTVHAAAAALHLTQTAVTQRIHVLESRLKTTLFIRSRRGMRLTSEGKVLYRYCQRVAELSGETLSKIQGTSAAVQRRMVIAGPTSVMRSRVILQCQTIMNQFDNIFFTFEIDDHDDISHLLKSGEADLAILRPEQVKPEMSSKSLASEHYILVASSEWRHRKLIDIIANEKIIDFNPADQMTFSYLKKYGFLEYAKKDRHFVNNTETIGELFMAGMGYGVLTKEFAKPYIKSGQLCLLNQGKAYLNLLSLAWYPRTESPIYFSKLINLIK